MASPSFAVLLDDEQLVDDVRSLSAISNVRGAGLIVREWLVIGATIAIALYFDRWWIYLPAIIVIAARQHALGVIMHDATHFRLFTSRWANEYVSNFFCAFPVGMSTQGYRGEHLAHHLNTNTESDPYYRMFLGDKFWHWPKTRRAAYLQMLADVSGLNSLHYLAMFRRWMPLYQWRLNRNNPQLARRCTIDLITCSLYWAAIAALLTINGWWGAFLLLWVLPAVTFYTLFSRLRWISEHPYSSDVEPNRMTRHVTGKFWERWSIGPLNINYHIAHHLFPAVPLYQLPRVHARLMEHDDYRREAFRYETYLGPAHSVRAEVVLPPRAAVGGK